MIKQISTNPNYRASVIKIENLRKHSNADRLQVSTIYGNNIITGLDAKIGDLYVYFPLESAISQEYLSYTSSFEDSTKNADTKKKGFFQKHGRVRAVKLRSEKSEGYLAPISTVEDFCKDVLKKRVSLDEHVGEDFDEVCGHLLCWKYVPANQHVSSAAKKTKGNIKKYATKLIENQFHFHEDTVQLKRNIHKINPDDVIAITKKLHGCNAIISNVLVKKKLNFLDRIAKFFGVNVVESEYGMLYSSRTVIKNRFIDISAGPGFYNTDVWKVVADQVFPFLKAGISVTGEIVGYTPNGGFIQKDYDYGLDQGKLDFYAFKITYTSATGEVYVFSHPEKIAWCSKYGVKTPETFYYGKAKDLFPDLSLTEHWHQEFLAKLQSTYLEKDCTICKNKVPDEGVVLNKEIPHEWEALKLKSFRFLMRETEELDKGEVSIEDVEVSNTESNE